MQDLIRQKIILKNIDLPPEIKNSKNSLLEWFALSFGLISEGKKKKIPIYILDAIFSFVLRKKIGFDIYDIKNHLKKKKLKIIDKLIRYHIKKLLELKILRRYKNKFILNNSPFSSKYKLSDGIEYWLKRDFNEIFEKIKIASKKLEFYYKK